MSELLYASSHIQDYISLTECGTVIFTIEKIHI